MSKGEIAWNAYYDKYGHEPENSTQLQRFAKSDPNLENINFKVSRDTFNANKGKGKIDGISPASVPVVSKPKPPSKSKPKSKSKTKSKAKTKAKSPAKKKQKNTNDNDQQTTTSAFSALPAPHNDDDDYEYYYDDEPQDGNNTSLPPPVPDDDPEPEPEPKPKKEAKKITSFFNKKKKKITPVVTAIETEKQEQELVATDGYKKTGMMPPMVPVRSISADPGNGDGVTGGNGNGDGNTTGGLYGDVDYTGDRKNHWTAYAALGFSIFVLLMSLILACVTAGVLHAKLNEKERSANNVPSHYEGAGDANSSIEIVPVAGYWGWRYISWYDVDYNRDVNQNQEGYQIKYPLADIHVKYGDVLSFKQRGGSLRDDLYLVTKDIYDTCNFSNITDEYGDLDNSSSLWLADGEQMYNINYNKSFDFYIEDWSDYADEIEDNDLFGKLISASELYFASSYNWDRTWSQSCKGGLKIKVIIDGYRSKLPMIVSNKIEIDAKEVQSIYAGIGHLARMSVLQQFSDESRIRSEGDSGLTNSRGHYDGDNAYDDGTYTNGAAASIHNHADNWHVVGIGEIAAVLNGVEFQTRHNDYNLNMPSNDSDTYGAMMPVPRPPVPPEVLNAGGVNAQVLEMQEWFRAFKDQNKSHRNYTDYFKPIMCYLEGTWITDGDALDEPFDSDRHAIEAKTWKQLHDKIRWMANSGRKNSRENLAHLPSAIRNLVNDTFPIGSNWEYRIACHPVSHDIPTSRFRIVNDLSIQLLGSPKTREELTYSRRARFELNKYINLGNPDGDHRWTSGIKRWNYLDYIMEQIPGKDNYMADVTDELPDGTEGVIHYNTDLPVNSGFYSRYYGLDANDAMGSTKHRRGWTDRYLFAAKTTQDKVSPVEFNFETEDEDGYVTYHRTISRWSYAVPLEIIYMTPITKWDPYNIGYIPRDEYDYGRSGGCSEGSAFEGWTDNMAYYCPYSFFAGITSRSQADTADGVVCALDSNGDPQQVSASGHWITFPEIGGGVGLVRQRYPIFPIHYGGGGSWKEVKALEAVVLTDDYDDIDNGVPFFGDTRDLTYGFEVNLQGGGHQHTVYVPGWRIRYYWYEDWEIPATAYNTSDHYVTVESDERELHAHTVQIWRHKNSEDNWVYKMGLCRYGSLSDDDLYDTGDYLYGRCIDGHDQVARS